MAEEELSSARRGGLGVGLLVGSGALWIVRAVSDVETARMIVLGALQLPPEFVVLLIQCLGLMFGFALLGVSAVGPLARGRSLRMNKLAQERTTRLEEATRSEKMRVQLPHLDETYWDVLRQLQGGPWRGPAKKRSGQMQHLLRCGFVDSIEELPGGAEQIWRLTPTAESECALFFQRLDEDSDT